MKGSGKTGRGKSSKFWAKFRAVLVCVFAVWLLWYFSPRYSGEYSRRTSEEIEYLNSLRQKYSGKNRELSASSVMSAISAACSFLDGVEDNDSEYGSAAARALLFGTAYVESGFFPRFQDSGGDAIGLFQIEYGTFRDLWSRGIKTNHPKIWEAIKLRYGTNGKITFEDLQTNDVLCAIFARMKYASLKMPIPPASDLNAQAEYYKEFYNTHRGKGSVEGYVRKVSDLLDDLKGEVSWGYDAEKAKK